MFFQPPPWFWAKQQQQQQLADANVTSASKPNSVPNSGDPISPNEINNNDINLKRDSITSDPTIVSTNNERVYIQQSSHGRHQQNHEPSKQHITPLYNPNINNKDSSPSSAQISLSPNPSPSFKRGQIIASAASSPSREFHIASHSLSYNKQESKWVDNSARANSLGPFVGQSWLCLGIQSVGLVLITMVLSLAIQEYF